jgi:hypothetical protein
MRCSILGNRICTALVAPALGCAVTALRIVNLKSAIRLRTGDGRKQRERANVGCSVFNVSWRLLGASDALQTRDRETNSRSVAIPEQQRTAHYRAEIGRTCGSGVLHSIRDTLTNLRKWLAGLQMLVGNGYREKAKV